MVEEWEEGNYQNRRVCVVLRARKGDLLKSGTFLRVSVVFPQICPKGRRGWESDEGHFEKDWQDVYISPAESWQQHLDIDFHRCESERERYVKKEDLQLEAVFEEQNKTLEDTRCCVFPFHVYLSQLLRICPHGNRAYMIFFFFFHS